MQALPRHRLLASTPVVRKGSDSPIPTPIFSNEASFTSKREKRSDLDSTPEPRVPRPRIQSISRCFKRSLVSGPRAIGGIDDVSFRSTPGYSDKARQSYLSQCFTVDKVLGQGSFGRVYRCTDKLTGVGYAVKVSAIYNARAVEEVRKHESLTAHVNCVRFYKAWEEGRALHIQMELCDESLSHYLQRVTRIPESEVWRIIHHCLLGLRHFHSNKLLHMDIKPDNVFRCATNHNIVYKLGDFGLAVAMGELNKTDLIEGDSKYLAPELLDGKCDEKCDVFCVGISALELIVDVELPNNGVMWHQIREGHIPPTTGYSGALRSLITEMMTPDPTHRPSVPSLLYRGTLRAYSWMNCIRDSTLSVVNWVWPSQAEGGETKKEEEEDEENGDSSLEELKSSDDESYERMISNSYQFPSKSTSRTSTMNSFLHQESPSDFQTSHITDSRQEQPASPSAAESFIKRNTDANFIKPKGRIPLHESFDSPVRKQRRQTSYSLLTVPILESPNNIPARCSPQAWPGSPYLSPVRNNRSRSTLQMSNQFESSTPINSHIIQSDDDDVSEGEAFHKPMMIKRNLLDSFDDRESN